MSFLFFSPSEESTHNNHLLCCMSYLSTAIVLQGRYIKGFTKRGKHQLGCCLLLTLFGGALPVFQGVTLTHLTVQVKVQ